MRALIGLICAAMALAAAPALADDCKPLTLVTSVAMTPRGDLVNTVPVTINGQKRHFLLDTGGLYTQVSRAAADAMKLPLHIDNLKLMDVNGNVSSISAQTDEIAIGILMAKNIKLRVFPGTSVEGMDGILAPDFLSNYDVDLDFGGQRMNYFLPYHCPGLYWPAPAAAVLDIDLRSGWMVVPVTLDGHPYDAMIDTGATNSTIDMALAQSAFGLSPTSPDMAPYDRVNGDPNLNGYLHTFHTLSFGGVTVNNPRLALLPDKFGAKDRDYEMQTGSRIRQLDDYVARPHVIIGMNLLRRLHLYVDFKNRKIYITPADDAAAKLLPPLPDAAADNGSASAAAR